MNWPACTGAQQRGSVHPNFTLALLVRSLLGNTSSSSLPHLRCCPLRVTPHPQALNVLQWVAMRSACLELTTALDILERNSSL